MEERRASAGVGGEEEAPLVGNLVQVKPQRLFLDVEGLFNQLRTDDLWLGYLGKNSYHFRHPDDVGLILRDEETFRKVDHSRLAGFLGDSLPVQRDISKHRAQRAMVQQAFQPANVNDLVPMFARVGDRLAGAILSAAVGEEGEVDVQALARRATHDVIGMFGFGHNDFEAEGVTRVGIVGTMDALVRGGKWLNLNPPVPDWLLPNNEGYVRGCDDIRAMIRAALEGRRAGAGAGAGAEGGDLLGHLLVEQAAAASRGGEGGGISDEQIVDELMAVLFAGADTSATLVSFLLYEWSRRPEAQERAAQEVEGLLRGLGAGRGLGEATSQELLDSLPFLQACMKETLRLWPPALTVRRVCTREAVLPGGAAVPQGLGVVVHLWSMHRHPEMFPRALEWIPERWLPEGEALAPLHSGAYLPFGVGPRACIGARLGHLEVLVLLATVLPRVALEAREGFEPEPGQAIALRTRGARGMAVAARPRRG